MDKYQEVVDYINDLEAIEKTIQYGEDEGEFEFKINERVDIDDIFNAINNIVGNVVDQEFAYELIDLMLPYYLLTLFTDIDPPMLKDSDGEYPDYVQCFKIATYLNLEYELAQSSPMVAGYIYTITQNIWRRLEYKKSEGAFIKEELNKALLHFYEVMDEIDEVIKNEEQIDIDGFVRQMTDLSEQLETLNNETNTPTERSKTSIDLAVVDAGMN